MIKKDMAGWISQKKILVYENIRFLNEFRSFKTVSVAECMKECEFNVDCVAIVFTTSKCYFYDKNYKIKRETGFKTYLLVSKIEL